MKRLFYFTGYRLRVLHWKDKTLIGSSSFEPTEDGLDQFRNYLLQTENIPSKLLVDVIEEDFRNERIPHVGSKDRKAVINRLIDRYYRSSHDFSYSEIIGRKKQGRKDDIVLLAAMTNPQLINPWLSIIDECEVQLSGIWTLPLVSKKLLKLIKATNGVVLLVSQQVNSNIRQTLFRDGRLISSRQSIVNLDISDISAIGKHAAPEVDRTIDFLRAQNLIEAHEKINLHILGANEQFPSLEESFEDNEKQSVTFHSISEIHNKLGLSGVSGQFSDSVFAWLCLDRQLTAGHYGTLSRFHRYNNKLAAMFLYAASLVVVIAGVLMTQSNISDAMEYEKAIAFLKQEEQKYKEIYSKKFKDFEEVFQNAGVMNSAVALAERIKLNGSTSPLDFLISLSNILAQNKSGSMHIDKIEWQAINIDEKNNKIKNANFTDRNSVKHSAVVTGRIDDPEYNYRASVDHIQRIMQYLKNDKRVENVETLKMPVDLRSESKFSTESGIDTKRKHNQETSGIFSFRITMKEPGHVE